jgi:hypothetical protein
MIRPTLTRLPAHGEWFRHPSSASDGHRYDIAASLKTENTGTQPFIFGILTTRRFRLVVGERDEDRARTHIPMAPPDNEMYILASIIVADSTMLN